MSCPYCNDTGLRLIAIMRAGDNVVPLPAPCSHGKRRRRAASAPVQMLVPRPRPQLRVIEGGGAVNESRAELRLAVSNPNPYKPTPNAPEAA